MIQSRNQRATKDLGLKVLKGNENIIKQTEAILRHEYSPVAKSSSEELVVAMTNLVDKYATGAIPHRAIVEETTKTIHRLFDFEYVGIVTKDPDGKYRFKTIIGITDSARKGFMQLEYSDSDLFNEGDYPSTRISDITRFYMAESSPFKPQEGLAYSRPQWLSEKRTSPDEMLGGDYIDVFIKGPRNTFLGYIEVGVPRDSKFPDKGRIRWLETISRILSVILSSKNV